MAAAALAADRIAEPPAEPLVPAAEPAPDPVAPVETAPDPAPETVAVEAEDAPGAAEAAAVTPLPETAPDSAPVVDLPSNLRPLPRPLQTLDPLPPADLAEIEAAPEPADLTVEDPTPVQSETDTPPDAAAAGGSAVIVAAPLPEPEPEPVVPTLPDEPQGVLYVSSAGVTVRAGPSAGDRAVDELPRGSAVVDLGGKGDGWRMILLPNGAAGYVSDSQLSLTPGQ